ncbi:hypothetical protein [Streptomyces sp. NPDC058045]|uniref:hypothetical protein n=1 Tax=Streptomyces sp. NPDC058045 TaxID=3346311 RepID=UPI0036E14ECC
MAAFREARDSGAHRARPRRRDDWRPRPHPRLLPPLSVKGVVGGVLAAATAGGVAMAAIGVPPALHHDRPHASATPSPTGRAPGSAEADRGSESPEGTPSEGDRHSRGAGRGRSEEALCRAYLRAAGKGTPGKGTPGNGPPSDAPGKRKGADGTGAQGKGLGHGAWKRLVGAAGGEKHVDSYCAGLTATGNGRSESGSGHGHDAPGTRGQGDNSGNGKRGGKSGDNGKSDDGNGDDSDGNADSGGNGNGNANSGGNGNAESGGSGNGNSGGNGNAESGGSGNGNGNAESGGNGDGNGDSGGKSGGGNGGAGNGKDEGGSSGGNGGGTSEDTGGQGDN